MRAKPMGQHMEADNLWNMHHRIFELGTIFERKWDSSDRGLVRGARRNDFRVMGGGGFLKG